MGWSEKAATAPARLRTPEPTMFLTKLPIQPTNGVFPAPPRSACSRAPKFPLEEAAICPRVDASRDGVFDCMGARKPSLNGGDASSRDRGACRAAASGSRAAERASRRAKDIFLVRFFLAAARNTPI